MLSSLLIAAVLTAAHALPDARSSRHVPAGLSKLLERARTEPAGLARDLRESSLAQIADPVGPSAAPLGLHKRLPSSLPRRD